MQNKVLRIIEETIASNERENIDQIISNMTTAVRKMIPNITDENLLIKDDTNPLLFYQIWKNSNNGIQQMKKNALKYNLSIFDFGDSIKDSYTFMTTEILTNITQIIADNANTNLIELNIFDEKKQIVSLKDLVGIAKLLLVPSADLNLVIYKTYYPFGIDIYDPKSPAFIQDCYFNKKLEYDLVQEYRKFGIFQNKTITIPNKNCNYSNIDILTSKIGIECPLNELNSRIGYSLTDFNILRLDHHDENLPTKCGKYIDNITSNFGFWINLCLMIIYLIIAIVLIPLIITGKCFSDPIFALVNDVGFTGFCGPNKTVPVETEISSKNIDNKEIVIEFKTYGPILVHNLLTLHPLLNLCKDSFLIHPLYKLSLLFFNIITVFGFNALFYDEGMIDQLRLRTDRNDFVYPIKYEFLKILYSILVTIGLNILLRTITLVTISHKNKLIRAIDNSKSDKDMESQW